MNSKLDLSTIVDLAFTNTVKLTQSWLAALDHSEYETWSNGLVKQQLELLTHSFYEDKKNFMDLTAEINDMVVKKLSIKNAESVFVSWMPKIGGTRGGRFFGGGWWLSSMRSQLKSFNTHFNADKESFLRLFPKEELV